MWPVAPQFTLLIFPAIIGMASGTGRISPHDSASRFDVLVYGATSGGVMAAVAAARAGAKVALLDTKARIGGMSTSGLSSTGNPCMYLAAQCPVLICDGVVQMLGMQR